MSFINQALRGALPPPAAAIVFVFDCCVVNRLKILRILRRETRLIGSTQILQNSNVARSSIEVLVVKPLNNNKKYVYNDDFISWPLYRYIAINQTIKQTNC